MNTEIIVRLKITSKEYAPDVISGLTGLQSDYCWSIGDCRPHTIIREKENGWIINSGKSRSDAVDEQILAILEKISQNERQIKEISLLSNVELSCVFYISVEESVPELNISSSIVEKLADIGASIDVDIYVMTE